MVAEMEQRYVLILCKANIPTKFTADLAKIPFYGYRNIIDFLIHLNQHVLLLPETIDNAFISNPKILDIISYINEHITEDISIDSISSAMFINRSYMMHLFKSETGYSIMKYIERKRLYTANSLINSGISKTEACYKCGFRNYSAYYHANRKYSINKSSYFLSVFE